MCQLCVDAIKEHWPDLPSDQYDKLLIDATSWPFGCGEEVAADVEEMARRSGCDLNRAINLAEEDLDKAMEYSQEAHRANP